MKLSIIYEEITENCALLCLNPFEAILGTLNYIAWPFFHTAKSLIMVLLRGTYYKYGEDLFKQGLALAS